MSEIKLELKNISKSFPGVKALDGVNIALRKGTVHAVMGENGAGKSTLMKIINGLYQRDEGQVILDGKEVHFSGPMESQAAGIAMILSGTELLSGTFNSGKHFYETPANKGWTC